MTTNKKPPVFRPRAKEFYQNPGQHGLAHREGRTHNAYLGGTNE